MKHAAFWFRLFLIAAFAVWFGGFTLYVSIVVPTGTEVLGSARIQGAITQQVTHWINLFCGISVTAMLIDGFVFPANAQLSGPDRTENGSKWSIRLIRISATIIGLLLLVLIALHPMLDGMLEGQGPQIKVADRQRFYPIHRIYLWVSTLQWVAGWVWLAGFAARK